MTDARLTMLPGLCSVTLRALEPQVVIDVAARAGLRAIEWGGDVHVPHGDFDRAQRVGEATRAAGLIVASYGSYYGARAWDDPAVIVDTACALGAANIRVWSPLGLPPNTAADSARAQVVAHLMAIAAHAAASGLSVSLEFHPGTLTETAASTLALLAEVGAANLHCYWQPDPTLALDDQRAEFNAVSPHVSALHVFAWNTTRERLPLSAAADLWCPIIRSLAAPPQLAGSGPRAAYLEFVRDDDPAQVEADARTLLSWLAS